MFPFLLQAWWVGDTFSADVWRICLNATNCTEIGYDFDGECEPDGEAQSEGRMLFPDSSPPPPSAYLLGGAWLRGGLEFWEGGAQCMLELGTASAGDRRACDEARGWKGHRPRLPPTPAAMGPVLPSSVSWPSRASLPHPVCRSHLAFSSLPPLLSQPPLYMGSGRPNWQRPNWRSCHFFPISAACGGRNPRASSLGSCVALPWGRSFAIFSTVNWRE